MLELTASYWYLRAVENRLQMRRNEQTHTLPEDSDAEAVIAGMMGEESLAAFRRQYRYSTSLVRARYAELFVEAKSLSAETAAIWFSPAPRTIPSTMKALEDMGFADPRNVSSKRCANGIRAAIRRHAPALPAPS